MQTTSRHWLKPMTRILLTKSTSMSSNRKGQFQARQTGKTASQMSSMRSLCRRAWDISKLKSRCRVGFRKREARWSTKQSQSWVPRLSRWFSRWTRRAIKFWFRWRTWTTARRCRLCKRRDRRQHTLTTRSRPILCASATATMRTQPWRCETSTGSTRSTGQCARTDSRRRRD